ncbi:probable insulin-like peptide 3 [Musca vetustissima]|uniref:probable insulin-like peptide 3 n=1 Tax=Musca vetustissima TaxID=27455 RepID=UPI002AB7B4CC|nr:probable insulin-like peptide 3 [Musca vetustissima]
MKIVYCILCCVISYKCLAQLETRVCGPSLSQLLETVCVNGFNARVTKKSNVNLNLPNAKKLSDTMLPYNPMSHILFNKRTDTMAKVRKERLYTGVYDECCLKTCSLNEILGYCL